MHSWPSHRTSMSLPGYSWRLRSFAIDSWSPRLRERGKHGIEQSGLALLRSDRVDAHAELDDRIRGDGADRDHLGPLHPRERVCVPERLAGGLEEVPRRAAARETDRVVALAAGVDRAQRVEQ